MPAVTAWTSRMKVALPASTYAAHSASLQQHIQFLAMAARDTPNPQDCWERDGAGLRGSPGQGPQALLPAEAKPNSFAMLESTPTSPCLTSSILWQEPKERCLLPSLAQMQVSTRRLGPRTAALR